MKFTPFTVRVAALLFAGVCVAFFVTSVIGDGFVGSVSGIPTISGTATNLTVSNLFTMNVLAIPTNTYDQTGFTYSYTNTTAGHYFLGTQAGGFAGMYPGYSVNFGSTSQFEIMGFVGGNANGSGGNSVLAIVHYTGVINSFNNATPASKGINPNAYTFFDITGAWKSSVDGGGQGFFTADEQQGFMLIGSTFVALTNSISFVLGKDPDVNPCFAISSPFYINSQGIVTVANGAPFNSLNVRKNGDITAYNGKIISELSSVIGGTGLGSSNTQAGVTITGTGITNNFGVLAKVLFTGTAVTATFFNSAGAPYMTNTITGTLSFVDMLQAGGKVTCASGGGGLLVPQ